MSDTAQEVTSEVEETKTPSNGHKNKFEEKRAKKQAKWIEDRKAELKKAGAPEEIIDRIIDQELYDKLPIDQKVSHLEHVLAHERMVLNRALNNLAGEMISLRNNQEVLADSMDCNFRAMERILTKLGMDSDTQKKVIEEVTTAFFEEKKAAATAKMAEMQRANEAAEKEAKEKSEASEKERIEAELKGSEKSKLIVQG